MKKAAKKMITEPFKMANKPIRNSAKAIIIRNNKILLTRNRDLIGDYFLLPGGGQNHKETLDKAIIRECREETGAIVKVGKLLFIREYIAQNHDFGEFDSEIHQVEFIFECDLIEDPSVDRQSEPDATQISVDWIPVTDLSKIRFYPSVLSNILNSNFKHDSPSYLGDTL